MILNQIYKDCKISKYNITILEPQGFSEKAKLKLVEISKSINYKYNQACLSAKVVLRGANSKYAYEILRNEGPFAILPIGGDLFQIV